MVEMQPWRHGCISRALGSNLTYGFNQYKLGTRRSLFAVRTMSAMQDIKSCGGFEHAVQESSVGALS